MASRKDERAEKEERAQAAAELAAKELRDVNQDRERGIKVVEHKEEVSGGPGVIGSILKSVQGTLGQAKEVVVGKAHDTAEVSRENTDYAYDKGREGGDVAAQKAEEAKEKAKMAKDTTTGKAEGRGG
uniref:Uncharacterized protein n=1 Tax=Daucus carota subsp. sativus TaxID=79200 RepID=A0A164WJ86_DAUCS